MMPAESKENPLLKKGNSDAFFKEKYLTKNNCLQPFNMDRVTSGESSADSVQLAVAAFLIAKLLAPFRGGILAGKHGGSAK